MPLPPAPWPTIAVVIAVPWLAISPDRYGVGLLYGQGEYVTKHHALVLGEEVLTNHADTAPSSAACMEKGRPTQRNPEDDLDDPCAGTRTGQLKEILTERARVGKYVNVVQERDAPYHRSTTCCPYLKSPARFVA